MLVDLTVKEFLNKVAGSDPVPGGGSIAALNGPSLRLWRQWLPTSLSVRKANEEHEERE